MTTYLISLSLLICAVLLIRAVFRRSVSPRVIYALWMLVVIRMLLPVTLFSVETELPAFLICTPAVTEQTETLPPVTEDDPHVPEMTADPHPVSDVPSVPAVVIPENTDTEAVTFPYQKQPAPITEKTEEASAEPSPVLPENCPETLPEVLPEKPSAVTSEPIPWKRIAGIAWLSGSLLLAVWFAYTGVSFEYRLHKDRRLHRTVRGVRVYVSGSADVPCVAGLIPSIYITPEAAEGTSETLILIHEYMHIRHGDPVWSVIRALALILLWWNPLVWAAAILSGRDAELACDDAVSAKLDDANRLKYANILLDTVPQKKSFAVGLGSAPLKERILRLTGKRRNRLICVLLAVVLSVSAAGCAFAELRTPEGSGDPASDGELSDTALYEISAETLCETVGKYAEAGELPDPSGTYDIRVTGLCTDVRLSMRGTDAERMQVYGRSIPFAEPLALWGNYSFSLFSVNDAVIIEGGYYKIGTVYVVTPAGEQIIPRGETMSYWLYKDENGALCYYRLHNMRATIIQTGGLSVATGYDELYQLSGKAEILDGAVVFGEPEETVYISDYCDFDREFELFYKDRYAFIEAVFAENKRKLLKTQAGFCGPYSGFVRDAETEWIDLYAERDGTLCAQMPYEIFRDWAGMDRTNEEWKPGWMDGIAFYYAAFGETRWAAAHLMDTVLSVGRKITAISHDGGETWSYDMTTDCGGNHVTCIGFANENTAFMGFDPTREFDSIPHTPAVSRTTDGGKTWERIDIPVPEYPSGTLFLPVSFLFDGAEGRLLLDVLDRNTVTPTRRITVVTHDGGMTWEYRQDTVTVTEKDGWDYAFSALNYDGMISDQCRMFFADLLSGHSAIPEYNALGIKKWSITRDDSLSDGYSPAFRFTFTVTGGALDTFPPGTYTRNVYDIVYTIMEDPDHPEKYAKGSYPAQYETAAEAVFRYLGSAYNWYCAPFGEWSDVPVNYIIYQSTQDEGGMPSDSMPVRDFLENAERLCGARLTEEQLTSLYGGLVYVKDGTAYVSTGGIGGTFCAFCTGAEEITAGRIAVTVQLYADVNGFLPSHLVQYEVSPDGILYGCRLLKQSPYPPLGLTAYNTGIHDSMMFLPSASGITEFDPEAFASLIPDESAQPLLYHRFMGSYTWIYLCAIREWNSDRTWSDTPPRDFAVYYTDDFGKTIGRVEMELPDDLVYDSVMPVMFGPGGGSMELQIILRMTKGDEGYYVSFDNFSYGSGDYLDFRYKGRVSPEDLDAYAKLQIGMPLGGGRASRQGENCADTPDALSSLGLPEWDSRLSYIRAFISGDTAALEELCHVKKGVYESYGTIRLSAWKAWMEKDEQGTENLYFSFYPTASDVNAFAADRWNTYILSDGMGIILSDADGTGDTDWDVPGEAAWAVGSFLRSTRIRELPDKVVKDSPESFSLTCYICHRLYLGTEDITEASVKAYAKDYFGIEDFQPDEPHLTYGCAHGGSWQALTVTDERDNPDGTASVTVQFYADRAKTVCSHTVMYTVKKIGTEWAFLHDQILSRASFDPFGFSM